MSDAKVLIINPAIRLSDKPRHIPHGLAILANAIRTRLGVTPEFLDINAHRYSSAEVESAIRQSGCDIFLMGGLAPVYGRMLGLSKLIKSVNPDSVVIAGGSAAMSLPDLLLDNSCVDVICTGEGEVTVVDLLGRLFKDLRADLSDIPGIYFRGVDGGIVKNTPRGLIHNLDQESFMPAYDLLPMEIYLANPIVGMGRDIDFISSRGCPYRCAFCYQPWGRKFRAHSVDFILRALVHLKDVYDIDFVSFQDDEFMANRDRVLEFCEKKDQLLPDLLWSCTGRANIVTKYESIVGRMMESGCVLISYGFESGSPRMLDNMKKSLTIEQMEKTVAISRKYGMPMPCSFIIGMPGEDSASCDETLAFALRNNLPLDSLMYATPYPGTELFEFAVKTGRIESGKFHDFMLSLGDARDFTINLTDSFSNEELIQRREKMMKEARANYEKFITTDEIMAKNKKLFGSLMEKYALDDTDMEHRAKHGGISIF